MTTTRSPSAPGALSAVAEGEPAGDRWERHPADVTRLLVSLAALAFVLLLTAGEPEVVTGISRDLVSLLAWLPDVVQVAATGIAQLAAVLGPVVVLGWLLWRRRFRLVAVIVGAAAVAAAVAVATQGWLDDTAPPELLAQLDEDSWLTGVAFPSPAYLAALAAGITVLVTSLRRPWRRTAWWTLAGAALLRLVTAVAVPLHVGATMLIGLAVGSAALVALGAPSRRIRTADIAAAAARAGCAFEVMTIGSERERFGAVLAGGTPATVSLVDRDERDADLLYRILTAVQRRSLGEEQPGWSPERLIHHEAMVTMLAARGGVAVPDVLGVGSTDDGAGVLVTAGAVGRSLRDLAPEELTDDLIDAAWAQAALLHHARIAHRRLNVDHLELGDASSGPGVVVTGLRKAQVAADDTLLGVDIAELAVSLGALVGPERALIGTDRLEPAAVAAGLPVLQRLALSPAARRDLRRVRQTQPDLLDDLRTRLQEQAGVETYELASIQRLSMSRILGIVGVVIIYYLVLAFAANWDEIVDALGEAEWSHLGVVLVLAALTYPAGAISLIGAVTTRLPLGQTTEVMLGQSFLNRFTPANAGGMALRARYLQRNGADLTVAATSVGLTSLASGVMQVLFVIVFLVWSGRDGSFSFDLPTADLLAVVVVIVLVASGVVWFTPLRGKLLGSRLFASVGESVRQVRELATDPAKVALLFGGAGLGKIITIAAFAQSCRAFGIDLSFAELGALYLTANTVASAAPTPGGVGAIEAALIAVLTGAGVDPPIALSTVLIFRLATYWLPVPFSWLALRHLRKSEIV